MGPVLHVSKGADPACVLEVGTLQQEDPERSTGERCVVMDQTDTLAGLYMCGFLTKCHCLLSTPPLLLCLYLVACPAGWQPLELGVAGHDKAPLAPLASELPGAKTSGSLVGGSAWSLPAAGHPSTGLCYLLCELQPAEPSLLG